MDIMLTHTSALQYWRTVGWHRNREDALRSLAEAPFPQSAPRTPCEKARALLCAQGFSFLQPPIHVFAPSGQTRLSGAEFAPHTSARALPQGSIVHASRNVTVSSPELCFVQMATLLSPAKLLEVGFELCGTYTLDPASEGGLVNRLPLTTAARISSYIERAEGANGTLAVKRVLPYLVDNSASPMETIVTILLCLPTKMGGYGFSLPVLNQRRNMGSLSKLPTVKDFYRCDLLWPEAGVSIEYDSKRYHAGALKRAQDKQRENALSARSVKTLTVTPHQVFSYELFDDTATMLALSLGRRMKKARVDWTPQRMKLRHELLDPLRTSAQGPNQRR